MIDTSLHGLRCRRCPVAPDSSCAGTTVPRLCELVDPEHPDHDPGYRVALRSEGGPTPAASGEPGSERRRRGLGETLTLLGEMRACPSRVEQTDCGCGGLAACTRGMGRNGVVHSGDCFDCLDANHQRILPS